MKKLLSILITAIVFVGYSQKKVNFNTSIYKNEIGVNQVNARNVPRSLSIKNLELNSIILNNEININDEIVFDILGLKQKIAKVTYKTKDINNVTTMICKFDELMFSQVFITFGDSEYLITMDLPEQNRKFVSLISNDRKSYYFIELDTKNLDFIEGGDPIIIKEDVKGVNKNDYKNDKSYNNSVLNNQSCTSSTENDPADMKVLIIYTQASLTHAGSQAGMNNLIAQAMARCNNASINSNLGMNFILSYSGLTTYIEGASSNEDLGRLRGKTDGFMDDVHTLRNTHAADFVHLISFVTDTGGLGYLLNNRNGNEDTAFALTRVQQLSWTDTLIHEIGHNMSAHHAKGQNVQSGPTNWSNWPENTWTAGWRFQGNNNTYYVDLMTYSGSSSWNDGISSTSISYFSSPLINYQGVPIGNAVDGDNTRSMKALKHTMSKYRDENTLLYCVANGNNASSLNFAISNVSLNTLNNSSSWDGYTDYSFLKTPLTKGTSYPFNITVSTGFNGNQLLVWIDWNNDGDFLDTDEAVYTSGQDLVTLYSTNITPPSHAVAGLKRMRIRYHNTGNGGNNTSCGSSSFGEVEDYMICLQENTIITEAKLNQTSGEINFTQSFPVTGDITIAGTTNAVGQGAGVTASIGMSFTDTNPNTWNLSHSWKILNYGSDNGNADVYIGNIGPMYQNAGSDVWYWSPGVYYFATRFTHNSTNYYGGVSTGNVGGTWDGTTFKNGKLKILTQVRASQGGTTYKGTNIPINADGVVNASDYTFEFRDATTDALITEVTTSTPVTNFGALMANATSRTYKIRVKANITGGESLPYGPSVNITLDLSTALKPNHCGLIVINHPTAKFEAIEVNGATNYQFEVTVNGGTPEVITTPNAFFNFGQLSSLPGNSAIIGIRVRAQIGGNYAEYGTSCNVYTKTQITQLFFSHCSLQLPPNNGTVVLNAIPVMNATNYEFNVIVNGGTPQTINGVNSYFSFSQLSAIPDAGTSIAVKVRATVNNVAGDWGNTCTVNTGALPRKAITKDLKEISAYPNPFYNSFTVKLIDNSIANIKIFEINGRIISNTSVNDMSEIELGNNLPTGIYLVKVEQNNETYSFKMVKN